MAMDIILDGLSDSVKDKIRKCTSAKELWDKLQENYTKETMQEYAEDQKKVVREGRNITK